MAQFTLRTRGFMMDLARLTERDAYYREVAEFVAWREANMLVLHLTDHQGCAFQFASHPTLATPYAYNAAEMRALIAHCEDLGIEVVPEIECFGHAGYATRTPQWQHLGAELPRAEFPRFFRPSDPDVLSFLDTLLAEICSVFTSSMVHVGCDEVAIDDCPEYHGWGDDRKAELFVGHVCALREILRRHGKTTMIWGDMLRRFPMALEKLPRDVVVCDWDYGVDPDPSWLGRFRDAGFRVLASPALVSGGEMVAASLRGHYNVARFVAHAASQGVEGVLTTIWVPQRVIPDALWPSLAFAAEAMAEPHKFAPTRFLSLQEQSFWRDYGVERFDMPKSDRFGSVLSTLWLMMPHAADFERYWWRSAEDLKRCGKVYDAWEWQRLLPQIESVYSQMRAFGRVVRQCASEYEALCLCARLMRHLASRGALAFRREVQAVANALDGETTCVQPETIAALQACLEEDRALEGHVSSAWDVWRYPDDPKKTTAGGWHPSQVLLLLLQQGRRATEHLLERAGAGTTEP